MSTGTFRTSIGILPATCTASVCIVAPNSLAISATSRMGKTTPVSLFAHMTETRAFFVPASAARSAPRSIWPTASTGSSTSSCPRALRRRAGWRTAGCSTAVVTTFIDGPYQSAEPRIAVLSLSVAQEVK